MENFVEGEQTDLQFNAAEIKLIDRDSTINYNRGTDQNAMAQVIIPFGKRSNILLSDGTKFGSMQAQNLFFPKILR